MLTTIDPDYHSVMTNVESEPRYKPILDNYNYTQFPLNFGGYIDQVTESRPESSDRILLISDTVVWFGHDLQKRWPEILWNIE